MPTNSLIKQNFHKDCEDAINRQIEMELSASYTYLSMAFYFDRDDIALPGFHWYFKQASDDERQHAVKFLEYINKRGGRIILNDIKSPEQGEWGSPLDAMKKALQLERNVNESLLEIHDISSDHKDANFCDFLENEFLQEQVDSIKEIAEHITKLERVGDGVGVHIIDAELRDKYENK